MKLEKEIETEELSEIFYQKLMICYCNLGQKSKAAKTYRQCIKVLKEILDVEPEEKTRNIYLEIVS